MSIPIDNDLINPMDFVSMRQKIRFQNVSTRTEIKESDSASILEIGTKSLVLELPPYSCHLNHNVMIEVYLNGTTDKLAEPMLRATGKIISHERQEDGTLRVTMDLIQFDDVSWQKFLGLYSNRQDEIERFFKMVKGY